MGCFADAGHSGLHWQNNGCCGSGRLYWAETPGVAIHSLKTMARRIREVASGAHGLRLKADRGRALSRIESLSEICEQLARQLGEGAFPEPIRPSKGGAS